MANNPFHNWPSSRGPHGYRRRGIGEFESWKEQWENEIMDDMIRVAEIRELLKKHRIKFERGRYFGIPYQDVHGDKNRFIEDVEGLVRLSTQTAIKEEAT